VLNHHEGQLLIRLKHATGNEDENQADDDPVMAPDPEVLAGQGKDL
jgi:hypothetical protein